MFRKKNRIIIGLTTFYTEFLQISVPAIAKLKTPVYLIIHNDNPDKKLSIWKIRKLGYFGPLKIINNDKNEGVLKSRLNIISEIKKLDLKHNWLMFADDGDLLQDIEIPNLKTFAVMMNLITIKHGLLNLLKFIENGDCTIDNENVVIKRPNMEIRGTLLNTEVMIKFSELLNKIIPELKAIEIKLSYLPPYNDIMWSYLQMYAEKFIPNTKPIYMDKNSYIAVNLDTIKQKYGKNVEPDKNYQNDMMLYYNLFKELLRKENVNDL